MIRIFNLGTDEPIQINNDKDQDVNNYEKAGLTVNSNDNTVIINETISGVTTVILSEFYQNIGFPNEAFPSVREAVDEIQLYIDDVSAPSPTPEETTLTEIATNTEQTIDRDVYNRDIQKEILQELKEIKFHLSVGSDEQYKVP